MPAAFPLMICIGPAEHEDGDHRGAECGESLGTMRSSGVCWCIPFSRSLRERVDLPQLEREDAGKTSRGGESTF